MNVRDIPDPAALGFKAPKWQRAHDEHARLQRQHTETLALQGDLRRRLGEAQDADSRAYADAIRAGKGDPGMPATEAVKSEQEAVVRKAAALGLALEQAGRELIAAVEAEKDAVLAEVTATEAERRATLQAAVDAWQEARTRHSESIALREFLNAFPDASRFKIGGGYMRNHVRSGDGMPPPTADHVLGMLRQDAAEPVEPVKPPNIQPLQPTMREIGVSGTLPRG